MAQTIQRTILEEIEDLQAHMNSLFQHLARSARTALPAAQHEEGQLAISGGEWLPAWRGTLQVDVVENGTDIVVTADMIPGITRDEIRLDLPNPQELRIYAERKSEKKEEKEQYFLHERSYGSLERIVPLPRPTTEAGASASLRNGVLEVRLKKTEKSGKGTIPIT